MSNYFFVAVLDFRCPDDFTVLLTVVFPHFVVVFGLTDEFDCPELSLFVAEGAAVAEIEALKENQIVEC
jgi:hypothetical protein